jgi:hypothetical protein
VHGRLIRTGCSGAPARCTDSIAASTPRAKVPKETLENSMHADGSLRLHTFATVIGLMLGGVAKIALGTADSIRSMMDSLAEIRAPGRCVRRLATGRRPTIAIPPELTAEQRHAVKAFELERWLPSLLS